MLSVGDAVSIALADFRPKADFDVSVGQVWASESEVALFITPADGSLMVGISPAVVNRETSGITYFASADDPNEIVAGMTPVAI